MFTNIFAIAPVESAASPILWLVFLAAVSAMLLVDLLVFNRKAHAPTIKEATKQSLVWIGLGVLTGLIVWAFMGTNAGAQYFTGYIIEKSLSVDNIFVWGLVLGFFAIPQKYRHRVLFWGIFGALIMRFLFIVTGVTLIQRFDFMVPLLGIVLLFSAVKILRSGDDDMVDVAETRSYKLFSKYIPVTKKLHGQHFFSRAEKGVLKATPLFLCLLVVEVTDVVFAVDSVPAILAVANDPFIIFASNAMAILGLRALFFLFDAIKDKFAYLGTGVAIVLAYVGIKMILSSHMNLGFVHLPGFHMPTVLSLSVIILVLGGSVIASMLWPPKDEAVTKD